MEGIAFPDVVRIEPAGRCNFTCRHCKIQNLRGVLAFDDFVRILEKIPRPRVLVLYHGGEPFLNRELERMVAHAKDLHIPKVVLNTNTARARYLPGLDEMRVSFDGASPEENDAIRVGGEFHRNAATVRRLVEMGQKVVVYNTQATGGEKPTVPAYLWDTFGDSVEYRTDPMRVWAGSEKHPDGYEVVELPEQPQYCPDLWDTFTVLANGDVVQCCEDLNGEYVQGNIYEEDPLLIWERMHKLRSDFADRNYPELCRTCYRVAGRYLRKGSP